MSKCYINGIGCVSAQETTNESVEISDFETLTQSINPAKKQNYKEYIAPNMIRRMAAGVKMGIVASKKALEEAGINNPDAIITGTGMGCLVDSEKFLKAIIENDEQYLTPTPFIQSTHNTVGAQVALGLKCKSYNVTYVHANNSFETAAIDALLALNETADSVLIGGVDEIAKHSTYLHQLENLVKSEDEISNILKSDTQGYLASEGSQFFVLQKKKTSSTYAELVDVAIHDVLNQDQIADKLNSFLNTNNMSLADVDSIFLGVNGDKKGDDIYHSLCESLFKNKQQVYYKHLSGEYNTVTAFGLWIAAKCIKNQTIPEVLRLNDLKTDGFKTVLLYNQNRGEHHSFTLLKSC